MADTATIQAPALEEGFFSELRSQAMRALESVVAEIAATEIPVLIVGESGTGKQVLARRLHFGSPRRNHPFLRIACAAATVAEIAGELRMPSDSGPGTVLFDEIGDLDGECQRKLLHALPDGEHEDKRRMLGSRVISTTSLNLEGEVRAKRFRGDLYYRINGVCLRIPPLRDRREDVAPLMDFFLTKHAARFGKPRPVLSSTANARLTEHGWPGNVRELENTMLNLVALADEEIALANLSNTAGLTEVSPPPDGNSLKFAARAASRAAERELIQKALTRTHWNRKRAAQDLRISYKSLLYKLKQMGLVET